MKITINPKFKSLIPPLTGEEHSQLEANLVSDGCRDALLVWNGALVDGHNRYEICTRRNIPFDTEPVEFASEDDACIWIIRNQLGRRNITIYTRAELVLRLEPLLKAEAKENQKLSDGKGKQKSADLKTAPLETRKELAKLAKVSHDTISKVKVISERASEETKATLRGGKTSINKVFKDIVREDKKKEHEAKVEKARLTPKAKKAGPFSLVLADPPWKYDHQEAPNRDVENQYPTATVEVICSHKPETTKDAILLLWATAPKLLEAIRVMSEWGFSYKTCAVWDKEVVGMGYWFRGQHELLLVGTKGKVSPPTESARQSSMFREKRTKHSKKPVSVYEWIEFAFPEHNKLEMYCREPRSGWGGWGNEV